MVCVDEKPVVLHADVRAPRLMRSGTFFGATASTNAVVRPPLHYLIGDEKETCAATEDVPGAIVSLDARSNWVMSKTATGLTIAPGAKIPALKGSVLTMSWPCHFRLQSPTATDSHPPSSIPQRVIMRDEESHAFFENPLVTFGEEANGSGAAFLDRFPGVDRYP